MPLILKNEGWKWNKNLDESCHAPWMTIGNGTILLPKRATPKRRLVWISHTHAFFPSFHFYLMSSMLVTTYTVVETFSKISHFSKLFFSNVELRRKQSDFDFLKNETFLTFWNIVCCTLNMQLTLIFSPLASFRETFAMFPSTSVEDEQQYCQVQNHC